MSRGGVPIAPGVILEPRRGDVGVGGDEAVQCGLDDPLVGGGVGGREERRRRGRDAGLLLDGERPELSLGGAVER